MCNFWLLDDDDDDSQLFTVSNRVIVVYVLNTKYLANNAYKLYAYKLNTILSTQHSTLLYISGTSFDGLKPIWYPAYDK